MSAENISQKFGEKVREAGFKMQNAGFSQSGTYSFIDFFIVRDSVKGINVDYSIKKIKNHIDFFDKDFLVELETYRNTQENQFCIDDVLFYCGLFTDNTRLFTRDRLGRPVMLDLWHDKSIDNRNKFIAAPSGTGMSFFAYYIKTLEEKQMQLVVEDGKSGFKMRKDLAKEFNEELDTHSKTEFEMQFSKGDDISIPIIQRKCKFGYNTASGLLTHLIKEKKIEKHNHIYRVL